MFFKSISILVYPIGMTLNASAVILNGGIGTQI